MNRFEELLKELKDLNLTQKSIDWIEDLPVGIWNKYDKELTNPVKDNLDIDTHRWYELSTSVYEIDGRYLGVEHISNLFSEQMDCSDVYHTLSFNEMHPTTEVTFK